MADDNFDNFVKQLQEEIKQKELEEYNEYIVDLFHKPKNWGKPPDNKVFITESYTGPCGDTMKFFLNIKDKTIKNAWFITDGCGASVATASQTTILIEGKSLEFAEKLTAEDIDDSLGGLPEDHKHCATLAARTLRRAIKKFKKKSD